MSKRKIVTIVGTRPEVIRLSRVLPALDEYFDHTLIHTGQNFDYELNEVFFCELSLRQPDIQLETAKTSKNVADTVGNVIRDVFCALEEIKPSAVLILGDTNSCLSAIAAKKLQIPIFHIEAGNRCFDSRVPEESNRKLVDHLSDINLTYSQAAKQNLLNEGYPADQIIAVGSPMYEVVNYFLPKVNDSQILDELTLSPKKYFLFSLHREENTFSEQSIVNFCDILNCVANRFDADVIVSTHPRTKMKLDEFPQNISSKVRFLKPLGFLDYLKLQMASRATLSDSGTITEEASILGFPAINLRETHERHEGMEEAVVMMAGNKPDRVLQTLALLELQVTKGSDISNNVPDYNVRNFSNKVVRILQSYPEYIMNKVYFQSDQLGS